MIANYVLQGICCRHNLMIAFDASYERGVIHSGLVENKVDVDHLKQEEFWCFNDNKIKMSCACDQEMKDEVDIEYLNKSSDDEDAQSSAPVPNLFDHDIEENEWSLVS